MNEELARLRARIDHLQDETQKLDDVKHMLADDNQQLADDNQILVMYVVAAQAAAQATA